MRDVVDYECGTSRDAAGLALAFAGYDSFARRRPRTAQAVLDIMADQARLTMLAGHRILCLVQSDNPSITFEPVGTTAVLWNHAEWLDAHRKPGSTAPVLVSEYPFDCNNRIYCNKARSLDRLGKTSDAAPLRH